MLAAEALAPLKARGPLALAVSGGPDSTALMVLCARSLAPSDVTVLTVDHGLRPEAAVEADTVRRWAKALGLRPVTLSWDGEKPSSAIQAAARAARYDLMTRWCRDNKVSTLVTAHNLGDQAETVLMRLKRGSGVDGLSGIPGESWRGGVRLLRPLIGIEREELLGVLRDAGHPWIEDPSNEDVRYERIQIRQNWMDLEKLGLSRTKLAKIAQRMTRARTALDAAAREFLRQSVEVSDLGYCSIDLDQLLGQPEEMSFRALSRCLQSIGGTEWPPRDEPLERLLIWIADRPSASHTLGGCRLMTRGGTLMIARETGRISERTVRIPSKTEVLWDRRFQIGHESTLGDVTVGPLAQAGWAELKQARPNIPAFVGRALPALRADSRILAVPSIGFIDASVPRDARFSASFLNKAAILGV